MATLDLSILVTRTTARQLREVRTLRAATDLETGCGIDALVVTHARKLGCAATVSAVLAEQERFDRDLISTAYLLGVDL